jgi:2-iminoacetate synthase ThiH
MLEENVVSAAGTSLRHVAEISMQRHIHGAGYVPAQRDSRYNIVRVIDHVPSPASPRRARA